MTIPVNSAAMWKARFIEEMTRSVERAAEINKNAEAKTRQLTDKEKKEIFENRNYDYIKEIEI